MANRVCVIGGGPAGLTAAITAAENGFRTTLLEHGERVGKKLLLTGSGRCNFTNSYIAPECYHQAEDGFVMRAFSRFGFRETVEWFKELGIEATKKNDGWFYPRSEQSAAVLNALREGLRRSGVRTVTAAAIKRIQRKKDGIFQVMTDTEMVPVERLILATGGKSYRQTGADGSGYAYALPFGHQLVYPLPALCGLYCAEKEFFQCASGVRVHGKAMLFCNENPIECAEGELQFNSFGLSGIPIFQFSRTASIALHKSKKVEVTVDFLPDISDLESFFEERIGFGILKNLEMFGNGLFNKNLWNALLKSAGLKPGALCHSLHSEEKKRLFLAIKQQKFRVLKTADFEKAQVTTGGIDTSDVCPETMESKLVSGLRFAGEILNVDGICGGYNLQWCWTSGKLAGGRK